MGAPQKIETEWLRGYAQTYLPCDAALVFSPEELRQKGVDVLDLICLFGGGTVVFADKSDGPGAIWWVDGFDCDGNPLSADLIVETQEISIRVLKVRRLPSNEGPSKDAA